MSAARRLRRQQQQRAPRPEPLRAGEFPDVKVARSTLRAWVYELAAEHARDEIVAISNETDPSRVRVTLGTRAYWRYVAARTNQRHAWLRGEQSDAVIVTIGSGAHPRAYELLELPEE
jgi:hypothetical protein